ncbi:RNA-binding S4 domain-containing protein [Corynebacterium diphtheriae bv. mitis]|uniref:RNA-binding heat shock protein n=3 Tax=Corynebacterium TaxID=1716 RepID=Q6NGE9_CORDI|nr:MULTISPECIES: RNA-binding S4 domain-containing protein [Corynebacterium]ERA53772.1 putative RNA-binding heat shock protein [Corynebacterium diphtheriae DSM 43988]OLN16744.1 RNA-binding protein S4 [Corynebacterium diphtheriae subsp. lausannense]AEX42261.1 putative RNA-binding heat shock protein [Corynebacterium diphtheriae 31A]AEX44570.1 putative RNA-binding heat shock protein [Corynebacterium diphtheriae 241]AEX46779.1 putative RNA-binding heat shock protein [Corynebacterium diphtheriae INC
MAEDAAPVRIDVWVWAVRLLKTRSLSAQACKAGHIKLNGVAVKPSQLVTPGDRVRVWADHRERDVEVVSTVRKRVGAAIAQACYIDHSPPPPPKEILLSMPRRDKGAGRPTKKERRDIDRLRGRR